MKTPLLLTLLLSLTGTAAHAVTDGDIAEMMESNAYLREECNGSNAETGAKLPKSESLESCRQFVDFLVRANSEGLCLSPDKTLVPCRQLKREGPAILELPAP